MGKETARRYGNHPLVKYVRSLDGEFYLVREVIGMLGCARTTLNYLQHRDGPAMGPSHRISYGGTRVSLYTPERVAEIAQRLKETSDRSKGVHKRGRKTLWNSTELVARTRARNRIYDYGVRAARYTELGREADAARMLKQQAALKAKLAADRARRVEKVYGTPHA